MIVPAAAQSRDQALIAAAAKGDTASVERLIREGASVKAKDNRGRTALLAATHGNHVDAARALIAAGAEGRTEILKLTLPTADLKSVNRYGGTALIPAAHHGHPDAVRMLLATSIDKDHVNKLGWTALLEAVILGDGGPVYTGIVRLLVEAGANVNIADREKVTPLQHARRRGFGEMVRILEASGAR